MLIFAMIAALGASVTTHYVEKRRAPDFEVAKWANADPKQMTWESLRGNVVIVGFLTPDC